MIPAKRLLPACLAMASWLPGADGASPAHPVGYRGDGNGAYFDSTPPLEFWDGTPKQVEVPAGSTGKGKGSIWEASDTASKNILWKTEMPCWANTQPIVAEGKVFTKAEPNLMVCADANDGKILWIRTANAWACAGADSSAAHKADELWQIATYGVPCWDGICKKSTMSEVLPHQEFQRIAQIYLQSVQPRLLAGLAELDPGGSYEGAARSSAAAITAHEDTLRSGPVKEAKDRKGLGALEDAITQRIAALTGSKGVPVKTPWNNLVGHATSVPLSDGERVYAAYGQGQVVAWDLTGKQIWGKWFARPGGKNDANCVHIPSPALADGILIYNVDAKSMVGLDAGTGDVKWTYAGGTTGGCYSVGAGKVIRLSTAGGEPVVAFVTLIGRIVRIADGKQIGDLAHPELPGSNWSAGPAITAVGDLLLKGGGIKGAYTCYRLKAEGRDKITATKLYDLGPGSSPGPMGFANNGEVFFAINGNSPAIFDLASGKPLGDLPRDAPRSGPGNNNLIIGKRLLLGDGGDDRRWNNAVFRWVDISSPTEPKLLPGICVLQYAKPRIPMLEKYAKELYDLDTYSNNSTGYPYFATNVDTPMCAAGDRLYIRTTSHLYCIGSP